MKDVGVLGRERFDCLPLFWKMGPRSFLEWGGGTRSSDPRELWKSGLLIGCSLGGGGVYKVRLCCAVTMDGKIRRLFCLNMALVRLLLTRTTFAGRTSRFVNSEKRDSHFQILTLGQLVWDLEPRNLWNPINIIRDNWIYTTGTLGEWLMQFIFLRLAT